MVTVDKAIIARIEKGGKHFEILVDPELAYDLREGRSVSVNKMLAINQVFKDAKKGDKAAPSDVEKAFGTSSVEEVATDIVKEGDIQLTTEFRRKKIEERRKQIASLISKYAINPQTKLPHPQDRILNAMEQSHVNVDPFRPAESQVDETIKAIKSVLPISMEQVIVSLEISAQYASRSLGILKQFNIQNQQWLGNGSLVAKVAVPAGLKDTFYRKINAVTDGSAKIREEKSS
jgi:ribosome maturation protein SDO1